MDLPKKLKKIARPQLGPLWCGPMSREPNGGITFSLLSRFLVCRERFRVHALQGLRPPDRFNHRLEFGSMWHVCEEDHASGEHSQRISGSLANYVDGLLKRYPMDREAIHNWYGICETMFPLYVRHWEKHPDVKGRTVLYPEVKFKAPYPLPDGRIVQLRGRWDSVDSIDKGVYLQENKTKGEVDSVKIEQQLRFDLQTMLYLVALDQASKLSDVTLPGPIKGVRYNVIKRPRQYRGKKETQGEFLSRLAAIIADSPSEFFYRWKVEITSSDLSTFRRQCLDPILCQLCDWWEELSDPNPDPEHTLFSGALHWRHPYGVYNVLDEGGTGDLDHYLDTGNSIGLHRADTLFPELA